MYQVWELHRQGVILCTALQQAGEINHTFIDFAHLSRLATQHLPL